MSGCPVARLSGAPPVPPFKTHERGGREQKTYAVHIPMSLVRLVLHPKGTWELTWITEEPLAAWRRIWRGCLPMWQQQRALRRERLRLRRKQRAIRRVQRHRRLERRLRETEEARKSWHDAWCVEVSARASGFAMAFSSEVSCDMTGGPS